MKRMLVRASACSGLVAIAVFALVQASRQQPAVMAQERQPPQTTAKKKKAKTTVKKPVAKPVPAADRYAERYADRPIEETGDGAMRDGGGRVVADFSEEVPDAGPDLFPHKNNDSPTTEGTPSRSDPFNNPLADDRYADQMPPTDNRATERSGGYAPGSVGQRKSAGGGKTTSAATAKKRSPAAVARRTEPRAEPAADRYAQPGIEPFGAEPETGAMGHKAGVTPNRDPFGDAASSDGRQPIVGHGRPGMKQLEGPQAPSLVVEKAVPEEIQVGKPAIFAIRVQNVGTATAQGVEIHDVIPQGTHLIDTRPAGAQVAEGQVTWRVGTIKAGDEAIVEMELMPIAEGEIGSVATVHFAGEASARTRSTRPQLAIDVSTPEQVLMGEQVTMTIKVTNPGTGTATGIVISETIPEQLEHPAGSELEYEVGDLKPGESRQVELSMGTVKAGQVVNTLVARGEGQLQAEQRAEFTVVAPQLEVSMQGPKRRYLERQATYTVTVSNPGTAPAKEVQLVTHLPKGLKFVGANNSGEFDPVTNTVHWVLEELPAKESGQVTLTALPIEAGEQLLKVESVAERGLSAEQEEVVSVEGVAAILFQLADAADPIEVGGETTYEIRVVNQGSKAATNVELLAVFPPQLKPRSANGPTRDQVNGQEVRFQPLGRLPPKGETTYQIRAQGVAPGDLRVQVQLVTDEMQSPVTKEESTRVYADE
ncbi:MAG TPA: CARDB domain-containing protein [Pirellulales bacterium]|nr:CARDB domain-containing protein [Pirellulales bacterium]